MAGVGGIAEGRPRNPLPGLPRPFPENSSCSRGSILIPLPVYGALRGGGGGSCQPCPCPGVRAQLAPLLTYAALLVAKVAASSQALGS